MDDEQVMYDTMATLAWAAIFAAIILAATGDD
jgi:hypothetical protein